ncbi:TetR family transcriptional regulator [Corynebacterium canis]|uniref:TetR family transcriptional regulator n=1 Tax=Corynebacterium canis TaxID=679663 RepID=A0A5C5UAD4_9CORY|nr:TetR family transcriptional regulator [Corynebacterium canis]TWT22929.1 TetR family transcriptional regulator [Corynebacterium canis]WJY74701.1 transcriptional regulator BetI [Corynebacterium canis]
MSDDPPARTRTRLTPEARRAIIINAAKRAFAAAPYEAVSIAQIAHEADSSVALVHKYFSTKAELYTHLLTDTMAELERRRKAADDPQQSARERVRIMLLCYTNMVSELPIDWACVFVHPRPEPALATQARADYQAHNVAIIADYIGGIHNYRDEAALNGFFGFLSTTTLAWLHDGRPADHRHLLIDAALGALQGALGDWRQ